MPRNGRANRCGWPATSVRTTMRTPINRQPVTLMAKVDHGKAPGACGHLVLTPYLAIAPRVPPSAMASVTSQTCGRVEKPRGATLRSAPIPVSYTHLRAHETRHDLVCRLLLE